MLTLTKSYAVKTGQPRELVFTKRYKITKTNPEPVIEKRDSHINSTTEIIYYKNFGMSHKLN